MVSLFCQNSSLTENLQRHLKVNCPDLARTGLKIQSSQIRHLLKNLHAAKLGLSIISTLLEIFNDPEAMGISQNQTFQSQITGPLATMTDDINNFLDLINNAVDFEHYELTKEYRVAATASKDLEDVKEKESAVIKKVQKKFQNIEAFNNIDIKKAGISLKF